MSKSGKSNSKAKAQEPVKVKSAFSPDAQEHLARRLGLTRAEVKKLMFDLPSEDWIALLQQTVASSRKEEES